MTPLLLSPLAGRGRVRGLGDWPPTLGQMRGLRIAETRRARELRGDAPSAERVVWRRLRGRQLGGWKFVRQEPIGPYFADFVCREMKLIIEIDWATHSTDEESAHAARRNA